MKTFLHDSRALDEPRFNVESAILFFFSSDIQNEGLLEVFKIRPSFLFLSFVKRHEEIYPKILMIDLLESIQFSSGFEFRLG